MYIGNYQTSLKSSGYSTQQVIITKENVSSLYQTIIINKLLFCQENNIPTAMLLVDCAQ